jgi:hypothetical protein
MEGLFNSIASAGRATAKMSIATTKINSILQTQKKCLKCFRIGNAYFNLKEIIL